MKKMRVGVLGVGRFGRLHINVLQQLPKCEVVAVADIDERLLKEVSEKWHIRKAYSDAAEMIYDEELNIIDIVSDEDTHGRFVVESLEHKKHVFVEKPLATSYAEAQRIQDVARRDTYQVMVGNISRFSQPYVVMKRTLSSGKLGKLGMIQTKRHFSRAWFGHFGKRVHPVYESGIHDIDLILWYAETECRKVYAVERNMSGYAYPDLFAATLTFADGLVATLNSAWLVPDGGPQNLVETLELDGTIDADIELTGDKGTARYRMAHSGLSVWTDKGVQYPELTLWPTEHDSIGGAIRAELAHFLNQVEKGQESTIAPLSDSVYALKIAEAVVQSAKEGRAITL